MGKKPSRKLVGPKDRDAILKMAAELTEELRATDSELPFVPPSHEGWHMMAQTKPWDDSELRHEFETYRKNWARLADWKINLRIFLLDCRSHIDTYGQAQHMGRFERNSLWQILIVHEESSWHLTYLKRQCESDLEKIADLVRRIRFPKPRLPKQYHEFGKCFGEAIRL